MVSDRNTENADSLYTNSGKATELLLCVASVIEENSVVAVEVQATTTKLNAQI